MNLTDDEKTKIIAWARQHPGIEKIHLFGSRARGVARADSDFDLAIEMAVEDWPFWVAKFDHEPDLDLGVDLDLEWYDPTVDDLPTVGPAVKRDGILLYAR